MKYPKLNLAKLPQDIIVQLNNNIEDLFYCITWDELDYFGMKIKLDAKTKKTNKKLWDEINEKNFSLSVEGNLELYQRFLDSPLFDYCKHNEIGMTLDADDIFTHQGYWDWLLQTYPFSYIEVGEDQLEISF